MKKKKGFTLIELLAVIVILAVIALIVTPIVTGVVDEVKLSSIKESAQGYASSIDNLVTANLLKNGGELKNGIYDVGTYEVEVNGKKPTSGWYVVKDKKVVDYSFNFDGYVSTKGQDTVKGGTLPDKPNWEYKVLDEVTLPDNSKWVVLSDSNKTNDKVRITSEYNITAKLDNGGSLVSPLPESLYVTDYEHLGDIYMAYGSMSLDPNVPSNSWDNSYIKNYLYNFFKPAIESKISSVVEDLDIWGVNELKTFGCNVTMDGDNVTAIEADYNKSEARLGFQATGFWLRIPQANDSTHFYMWAMNEDASFSDGWNVTQMFGVRPIMTVSKSVVSIPE